MIEEAFATENTGGIGLYYIKNGASAVAAGSLKLDVEFAKREINPAKALAHGTILHDINEKVNTKVQNQTQTLQFARWFGDWQNGGKNVSKVVNADGSPKIVYHGTNADFRTFEKGDIGFHVGSKDQAEDRISGVENGRLMALYASIKNPLEIGMDFGDWHGKNVAEMLLETEQWEEGFDEGAEEINAELSEIASMPDGKEADDAMRNLLKRLGYDGIAYNNTFEGDGVYSGDNVSYIAFDSEQLKSATDNVGTFDSDNGDVYFSGRNKEQLDKEYISVVKRGDIGEAQRIVDAYAAKMGYSFKAYHGTPNGTFTVFKDWQYFTENESYADVYQNQGASSNGYKPTANNPKTYAVFINQKNTFDTRKPKERRIFQNEFYRKWGYGAPLSERGLPDWTDGDELIEFFEENGYDYDCIVLDEGGTGGYGDDVNDRGISYVVKKSAQIKSADPVTYDDDGNVIPLSERFNSDNADIRYSTRNKSQTTKDFLQSLNTDTIKNAIERKHIGGYQTAANNYDEQQRIIGELTADLREARKIKGANGNVRSLQDAIRAAENRSNVYAGQMARFEKDFAVRRVLSNADKVEMEQAERETKANGIVSQRKEVCNQDG